MLCEPTLCGMDLGQTIALPAPRLEGPESLEAVLARRRSCREFDGRPLALDHISQLLWAAQGTTDPTGLRTAPSAGARYPLRVRFLCRCGVFLYLAEGHQLRKITGRDLRPQLAQACYGQEYVENCGGLLLFTGLYARTTSRYGERGRRYVLIDLGHAAQNVHLQAAALGLASVPVGSFDDELIARICELPPEESPLYLIPAGYRSHAASAPGPLPGNP